MNAKHGNLYRSSQKSTYAKVVGARPTGIALDALETRVLLSGAPSVPYENDTAYSFNPETGIIMITGTDKSDHIKFWAYLQDGKLGSGYGFLVDVADVKGIEVFAGGGDDYVDIRRKNPAAPDDQFDLFPQMELVNFDIPVTVHGGAGNDEIYCESAADDVYYGDAGDHDQVALIAGNDLFSCEQVADYSSEYSQTHGVYSYSFAWADGGNQLFENPWKTHVAAGTYYNPDWQEADKNMDHPDGESYGDWDYSVGPRPQNNTVAPVVPPAQPMPAAMPTTMPVFSTAPIAAPHDNVWDDAAAN